MGAAEARVVVIAVSLATAVCLFVVDYPPGILQVLREALERFRGGGPPTPMHPSPADDGALLRRRKREPER